MHYTAGTVTAAAVQMKMGDSVEENIARAGEFARRAEAQLILLPELFERRYFCQERRYDYYSYAQPVQENPAVRYFRKLTEELRAVIPVSFYEKDGNVLYNSVAVLDCGELLGVYRKTHIPDDHFYQEKFYFTPGNIGFRVWDTSAGRLGIGICWDQWFPETARCMALMQADIFLFPTAIGSEPILGVDSAGHWRRTMQGHAAANVTPLAAANRIGRECVTPCEENGGQESALEFYGSSLITDETGEMIRNGSRDREEILTASFDFLKIRKERLEWGLFRDRRPEMYGRISG